MSPNSQTLVDLAIKILGAVLAPVIGFFVQRRLLPKAPPRKRRRRR